MIINIMDDLNFYVTLFIVLSIFVVAYMDLQQWEKGEDGNGLSKYSTIIKVGFYLIMIDCIMHDGISMKEFIKELHTIKEVFFPPITFLAGVTAVISVAGEIIKIIARRRKDKIVEIKLFDKQKWYLETLRDMSSCGYCKMICDSRMISEYILKKIKLYLRQDKVVIVYFCNVCMGNFEWLYRFYVYAYRELNVAELIDDKLIIKNIPYSLELDLVHIKEQAYKEVWGINK